MKTVEISLVVAIFFLLSLSILFLAATLMSSVSMYQWRVESYSYSANALHPTIINSTVCSFSWTQIQISSYSNGHLATEFQSLVDTSFTSVAETLNVCGAFAVIGIVLNGVFIFLLALSIWKASILKNMCSDSWMSIWCTVYTVGIVFPPMISFFVFFDFGQSMIQDNLRNCNLDTQSSCGAIYYVYQQTNGSTGIMNRDDSHPELGWWCFLAALVSSLLSFIVFIVLLFVIKERLGDTKKIALILPHSDHPNKKNLKPSPSLYNSNRSNHEIKSSSKPSPPRRVDGDIVGWNVEQKIVQPMQVSHPGLEYGDEGTGFAYLAWKYQQHSQRNFDIISPKVHDFVEARIGPRNFRAPAYPKQVQRDSPKLLNAQSYNLLNQNVQSPNLELEPTRISAWPISAQQKNHFVDASLWHHDYSLADSPKGDTESRTVTAYDEKERIEHSPSFYSQETKIDTSNNHVRSVSELMGWTSKTSSTGSDSLEVKNMNILYKGHIDGTAFVSL